jgi:hypothetical protein
MLKTLDYGVPAGSKARKEWIYFDLNQLRKLPNYTSYLYQWLNEFGFLLGMIFMIG